MLRTGRVTERDLMQRQKRGNAQPPTTVLLNEEVFAIAARIGIEVPARALGNLSEVTVA